MSHWTDLFTKVSQSAKIFTQNMEDTLDKAILQNFDEISQE